MFGRMERPTTNLAQRLQKREPPPSLPIHPKNEAMGSRSGPRRHVKLATRATPALAC